MREKRYRILQQDNNFSNSYNTIRAEYYSYDEAISMINTLNYAGMERLTITSYFIDEPVKKEIIKDKFQITLGSISLAL